jgi:hypothetical protein
MTKKNIQNNIIIYEGSSGQPKLNVQIDGETVWLDQKGIASLFDVNIPAISKHIQNIYKEGELERESTISKMETVQREGTREVKRVLEMYNLDLIISVGYRVNSQKATQFRIWATKRLREYLIKGFTIDDDRLKNVGGGTYWNELLDRIRDIRSSEKVLYRQVLDLYATSIDYDPKSKETKKFFAIVQNKLHYAANGKTASELISERVNSDKPFMGLMSFGEDGVRKSDVTVAKNYLTEQEIKRLNNVVSAYFDIAELRAMDNIPTKMEDYIKQLDKLIASMDRKVLRNTGKISHIEAEAKALNEYKKYQIKNLSNVEKEYLSAINTLEKRVKKKVKG